MARLAPAIENLLRLPDESRRIGPFVLVRQLGRGGFAPVWLAKEVYGTTELRTAAVKLFSLDAPTDRTSQPPSADGLYRSRVIDEARALCQVEHPGIVRFYALPTDDARGLMGLAMEHAAGTPLDQRLAEHGTLPIAEVLAVGTLVASALSAVHRAGLVHRDVKPANVVESASGYKLIDFGIAAASEGTRKAARADVRSVVLFDDLPLELGATKPLAMEGAELLDAGGHTAQAATSGTLGYMDPVCLATGAAATAASDLYALGAMLFECVTGKLPAAWSALAAGEGIDWAIAEGRSPAPALLSLVPDAPPLLARLLDALLSPVRRDRPRSAERVAIELDRLRGTLAGLERALPPESAGPFRGLGRFEGSDRDVYFGRTGEVAAAIEVLRGRGALALVGPSGSGKSSLARAGVLPRVAEGALGGWPRRWDAAICLPGSDARQAIAAALGALDPPVAGAAEKAPEALVEALAERARTTDRGLVLFVDQLEELATLGAGDGQAWTVELLARLGGQTAAGVRLLVTVRRDLLELLLGLGQLGNALVRGSLLVAPMGDAVWGEVIEQALSAYGYTLEDEALGAELLAQLAGTAGAMPLVQFALTELWRKRDLDEKKITREGLRGIGGIAGALERHADATLARFLEAHPDGAGLARRVILGLTTPQGTRALRRTADLERDGGPPGRALLGALEEARLVVREPHGVTLAHEALLVQWSTLRGWLAEAREDRLLAEEVERDAERFRADPDAVLLWKKRRLEAAEDVLRRGTVQASPAAAAFLRASRNDERRARGARAGAVLGLLAVVAGSGALYVKSVSAEKARADDARGLAEQRLTVVQDKTARLQEAQARNDELLQRLANATDRQTFLKVQEDARQARGTDASGSKPTAGASSVRTQGQGQGQGQGPGGDAPGGSRPGGPAVAGPRHPGDRPVAAPSATVTLQTEWE